MLKVVIDTNQFISSILTKHGPSAQLLQAWREHAYILVTSLEIVKEIRRVFQYPHITQKYHLQQDDIESLINLIEHEAVILSDSIKLDVIKDDPEDNKILACALEADAQYIVSGDRHLLILQHYKNIAIVRVTDFLKIIDR